MNLGPRTLQISIKKEHSTQECEMKVLFWITFFIVFFFVFSNG